MVKRKFRSSCVWGKTKKYHAAKMIGVSTATYCKYLKLCQDAGFIKEENGHTYFKSYGHVFSSIFCAKWKYISIDRAETFQAQKENIRAAIALYNLKCQDFLITGDRLFETKAKTKSFREAKAKSWVKNRAGYRAHGVKQVRTSSRSISKVIGMCHATANKTLNRLVGLKRVTFEYEQAFHEVSGPTSLKIAFAETNKPFLNCTYTLTKYGVKFHIGRLVNFK